MTVDSNTQLVQEFYRRMSKLEFGKMFELMADEATWTVAGNPSTFHHAGVATKPQRVEALSNFTQVFSSLDMEIRSTTAEGDRVAVELFTRCASHNGLKYENELLVLLWCRDGKICRIYEHVDQMTALDFERRLAEKDRDPGSGQAHVSP